MPRDNAPKIFEFTKIIGMDNITFGSNVLIDDFVLIMASEPMTFGNYVHLACFSSITGGARVTIGDFCAVSQGARLLTATDDFVDWGFGNSTIPEEFRNTTRSPIEIGRFAILGANSVVLPGVTIGEGVTVGAGTVVTRDLEPWGVYLGNRRHRDRDRDGVMAAHHRFVELHGSP
jgi:galactoside O-acetyltransferase